MRLWSIHPRYLDTKGLVACWREGLLARKVLMGKTKRYKNHPQLIRFKSCFNPLVMLDSYLLVILNEASKRGFAFDRKKIGPQISRVKIPVAKGQIEYEFQHLLKKLKKRDPKVYRMMVKVKSPNPHPIFYVVKGNVESWEKIHR